MTTPIQAPTRRRVGFRGDPDIPWDSQAELDLLRDLCRKDFWTFFLYAFGAWTNPRGKRWIEPEVHRPLAEWFQAHVDEWMADRESGRGHQKHLAILMHREVGKTTMITRAGQLWLHLRDPEFSSYTGSEKSELSIKMLRAMKAVMDGTDQDSLWAKLYGNWATSATTWTGKEIVHAGRRNTSRQDPSFGVFAVETSITGAHPDAIFYDDPISYERLITDTNWMKTVNEQVSSLFPTYQSDAIIVWVGCMAVGEPVLMADGSWKPIEDVQSGDLVYTTDASGNSATRAVQASIDQGDAETVTVITATGKVRCTPNHPFLRASDGGLEWIRADELKAGDLVAAVKRAPSNPELPWMTKRLAWLCGFILGDGWIGKNADYACIARSKDDALNERVLSIMEDWIPDSTFHKTAFGYLRCNSASAANAFRSLGLVGGAKTKRVPGWAYRETEENRLAFLHGFCEADGHKAARGEDSWAIEISNADLVNDLRLLARTCGVRVGQERSQRERWIKAPNSRERILSLTTSSHFNFSTAHKDERFFAPGTGTERYRDEDSSARLLGSSFRLDRVKAVVEAGRCRVWDLTVSGSASFVCGGYVVHNTRYGDDDHFGLAFDAERGDGIASLSGMETDSMKIDPNGLWHVYFMAGRDKTGKPTTPKVWNDARLSRYQRRDPTKYAAQIMNDPSISEHNPITREQIEQCAIEPKDVPWPALRYALMTDLALWDGKSRVAKDETVYIVHGYARDGSGDVYIIEGDGSPMWRGEDFKNRLVALCQRYRRMGRKIFRVTGDLSMAGLKGVWANDLANAFNDANEPFPGGKLLEFSRGGQKKIQRIVAAAHFWVDGHVKWVRGAKGVDRLTEQMAKIGQMMVNPKLKDDWADAHSDAFQPELYSPMRRNEPRRSGYDRGATAIRTDGLDPYDYGYDERRQWYDECPRPPLRQGE